MRVLEVGAAKGVGGAAPRPARGRVRRHRHPRRPEHRARPRRVLRGAGRAVRACPGRRRAPPVRGRLLRPRLLRRGAAPRARPLADGRRDGARHAPRRHRCRAERGHARGARERRGRGPGGGEGASGSTSTCTRSTRTCGPSRAPASWCAASSTPRATPTCATRRIGGKLRRLPGGRPLGRDLVRADLLRLLGRLALCPQGRPLACVSLTVYADLYRYRELFGEPLPARPPDPVQGLGARGRLVAAQPADPDGHLRARLLGALEGRRHRALRALPAGRPRRSGSSSPTSLTTASRSMVDSAALVKKVRFPRQLVPLSVVATQLVTFVAMLVVLMVVNADRDPRDPRHVPARDPDRRRHRRLRRRGRADRLLRERRLPRRRAPRPGGAAPRGSS